MMAPEYVVYFSSIVLIWSLVGICKPKRHPWLDGESAR